MNNKTKLILAFMLVICLFSALPHRAQAARFASPNDTARYLAGLQPSAKSPLARLTRTRVWRKHARVLNRAWARLERQQLSRVRAWSRRQVPSHRRLMLYMFSGPDFPHAEAFFPNASTYVLSALEPTGRLPNILRMSPRARARMLARLRASLKTVLTYSFFITKEMNATLRRGKQRGSLPVLYIFLARMGKTIHRVRLISLNPNGSISTRGRGRPGASSGVKITFSGRPSFFRKKSRRRTLYYFSTNLGNKGLQRSGFRQFVRKFGPADSLIKAASYLLHFRTFQTARKFLIRQSAVLIQDDSGVPVKYLSRRTWRLRPYGQYLGPIDMFGRYYQRGLERLFAGGRARRVDFGIGYRWHWSRTNILLAIKK